MNILDIIFLVLIAASVIYSLIKGLVTEIFSLLAIILGFFGASYGYSRAAEWLKGWVGHETLSTIIAFAFLFLLVAIAVSLLGRLLSRLIHKGGLGWADRFFAPPEQTPSRVENFARRPHHRRGAFFPGSGKVPKALRGERERAEKILGPPGFSPG
jgi:hypothetical protein